MAFEIAVQSALYEQLNSSNSLTSLVNGRIYDHVPQKSLKCGEWKDTDFPFITIGEATHAEWSVYEKTGNEVLITIHTWSRKSGRKEVKTIQDQIFTALDRAELSYPDVFFVTCDFQSSETDLDPDGETYHGVSTYRILIR